MQYSISIYKFKVTAQPAPYQLIGLASIILDNQIKITNIMIKAGTKPGTTYVSMPQYNSGKLNTNKKYIYEEYCHPLTKEFRESIYIQIKEQFESNIPQKQYDLPGTISFSIKIELFKKFSEQIRAIAELVIQTTENNITSPVFVIKNIFVKQNNNGFYLSYPAILTSKQDKYQSIITFQNKDVRNLLQNQIFKEYKNKLEQTKPFM